MVRTEPCSETLLPESIHLSICEPQGPVGVRIKGKHLHLDLHPSSPSTFLPTSYHSHNGYCSILPLCHSVRGSVSRSSSCHRRGRHSNNLHPGRLIQFQHFCSILTVNKVNSLHSSIIAFPNSGGSLRDVLAINLAAGNLVLAINTATIDTKAVPAVSENDANKVCATDV
jgi:hypothetical protein